MESSTYEKSVRLLPAFDGDEKNFQMWWMCFCAYARVYKFSQACKRTRGPNLPTSKSGAIIDESSIAGKLQAMSIESCILPLLSCGLWLRLIFLNGIPTLDFGFTLSL